jgi:hypothetical protein
MNEQNSYRHTTVVGRAQSVGLVEESTRSFLRERDLLAATVRSSDWEEREEDGASSDDSSSLPWVRLRLRADEEAEEEPERDLVCVRFFVDRLGVSSLGNVQKMKG